MDPRTTLIIAVPVLVAFGVVALATIVRRRDQSTGGTFRARAPAGSASPTATARTAELDREAHERYEATRRSAHAGAGTSTQVTEPPTPEEIGITRRQLFNRGMITAAGLALGGFGAASLAFLWPGEASGFGSKITVDKVANIQDNIKSNKQPSYFAEAKTWVTSYPKEALPAGKKVYDSRLLTGMEQFGLLALYQKCPHLGCRVPFCNSSQWFECPCHGSKYNRVGQKKGGPAPRGMDSFPIAEQGGRLVIDTGTIVTGQPIGVDTLGQDPEGPHCV